MLLNVTVTLLFTPEQPTTLQFPNAIEYYAVGNATDFDSYLTKDKKILLIRPKKKDFDEFLVVITKGHSYEFRLKSTPRKYTALYQILSGKKEKFYTLKKVTKKYRLSEGMRSLKIERIHGKNLFINDRKAIKKIVYYPKNAPLTIEGEEVF